MEQLIGVQTNAVASVIAGTGRIPSCGDGEINAPDEQCDGADLGGATCVTLGIPAGTLACTNCKLDTRGCLITTFPASGVTTSLVTNDDGDTRTGGSLVYTNNGDGTITDARTNLMWAMQIAYDGVPNPGSALDADNCHPWWGLCDGDPGLAKCTTNADCGANGPCAPGRADPCQDASPPLTVAQLIAILNQIQFAGHADWRLPNVKELQSIVDYGRSVPAIDPAFNGASCGTACVTADPACSCTGLGNFYWASTTVLRVPDAAWAMEFALGTSAEKHKFTPYSVRAVRGGL